MNKIKKIRRFKTRAKPKRNISRQGQRNYLNNELNTVSPTELEIKKDLSIKFLLYKWFLMLMFIVILSLSMLQFGRDEVHAIKIK